MAMSSRAISLNPNLSSSPTVFLQLSSCIKAAQQLRDVCLATGCVDRDEPQKMSQAWEAAHAAQIRAWAENTFSSTHAIGKPRSRLSTKDRKPTFNHEYTPLLEKYFEYNAYPSAMDRAVLAKRTMMTLRQIEVWFQNHRNRAKRDGRPLSKSTQDLTALEVLAILPQYKEPRIAHEQKPVVVQQQFQDNFSDEDFLPTPKQQQKAVGNNPLNSWPIHVLLPVYPPHSGYQPFTTKPAKFKFPAPVWYRRPAGPMSTPSNSIRFDDFITEFNLRLHLGNPIKKHYPKASKSWCTDLVIIPSPAPLPALIRTNRTVRPSSKANSSSQASIRLDPPSTSASPKTTTTVLSRELNYAPARRKVTPFPKRTPYNPSLSHRRRSIHMDDNHRQSSLHTARTSPYGSDTVSDRRTLSCSSDSSSSSSGPTTPVILHSSLPEIPSSPPVSIPIFDSDHSDDVLLSPTQKTLYSYSPTNTPKRSVTHGLKAVPKNPAFSLEHAWSLRRHSLVFSP